jgi:hypothetical protein
LSQIATVRLSGVAKSASRVTKWGYFCSTTSVLTFAVTPSATSTTTM